MLFIVFPPAFYADERESNDELFDGRSVAVNDVGNRLRVLLLESDPDNAECTTCSTEADRRQSEEAGIDLHLVKPLEPGYLRRFLRRFEAILGRG